MTFVLAHLSDPHLAPLPTPQLFELAGKRLGGFIHWQHTRRHRHLTAVLDRIVDDITSRAPDHIAVTGDLVNLSLDPEFTAAKSWLAGLGGPHDVTAVPGNHDTYVRSKARHPELHWADYMRGDDAPAGTPAFPFVRRRGPVALIGLSTAVPAPMFRATGRLGADQLARFAETLVRLERTGTFRVVLIHHPPISTPKRHHERLLDGEAFVDVLERHGAELVLHGHDHVHSIRWFDGPGRPVPAIGVPSASAAADGRHDAAAYNLYTIEGRPGAWRCEAISRGLAGGGKEIVELKRTVLAGD
jgi:3',5'-cyclic AMP phosphodiesterase CpdA